MSGAADSGGDVPGPLRLLLDTNIFIAAEPYSGALEAEIHTVNAMLRLASEQQHQVFLHPVTREEVLGGNDPDRVRQREAEFNRYALLKEAPISATLVQTAGDSKPGSNDHRDLRILAALHARAVTHLVTNDRPLLRRAHRAGLGDKVYTAQDALQYLRELVPTEVPTPPSVEKVPAYTLDVDQEIFVSLRADYEGFDKWLDTVRAESQFRPCFVVKKDLNYAAVALLKHEFDCSYPFADPVLKISTFKVGAEYSGAKYGELLLKALFQYAARKQAATLYVEVFEKYAPLLVLLSEFGFEEQQELRTKRRELVLAKSMNPPNDSPLSDLDYHKKYGPPALKLTQKGWVIPIWPAWHLQLFPDAPEVPGVQLYLPGIEEPKPWGNALRKAYLSHSSVTKLAPGDIVLFYRSHDTRALTVVGVIEDVRRSSDPLEILTYVGQRTVYSPEDIARLCRQGPVLAILFRQDRFLDPVWELHEVICKGLLKSWPQSITRIKEEGVTWLHEQLGG